MMVWKVFYDNQLRRFTVFIPVFYVHHKRQIANADASAGLSVNCVFPRKVLIFFSSFSQKSSPKRTLLNSLKTKDLSWNRILILEEYQTCQWTNLNLVRKNVTIQCWNPLTAPFNHKLFSCQHFQKYLSNSNQHITQREELKWTPHLHLLARKEKSTLCYSGSRCVQEMRTRSAYTLTQWRRSIRNHVELNVLVEDAWLCVLCVCVWMQMCKSV